MTTYFVDTSALFKRYVPEEGSEWLDQLLTDGTQVFISTLTIVELASNLQRLQSVDRLIDQSQFSDAWAAFSLDLAAGRLEVVGVSPAVVDMATRLLMDRYITPIDAIQLSTALYLGEDAIVVSSDHKMNSLVRALGMGFVDPARAARP
ncbi:MAG: type II toxin-antitoxin system VapC family toxin [Bacillota bacterium]